MEIIKLKTTMIEKKNQQRATTANLVKQKNQQTQRQII